jgi:hypothetical protein
MRNILKSSILAVLVVVLGSTTARADSESAIITVNTSGIEGLGTFSLAFQLADGSGTGNADNTVQLFNFNFGGGSASGSPLLFGGATGSVGSGFSLTNSDPSFNAAIQGFVPGAQLTFDATFTNITDTPFPDLFLVSILDPSLNGIPTLDSVYDSFITITLNGPTATYPSDLTQTSYNIPAPVITPEPASFVLLASACFLLLFLGTLRRPLKEGIRG